MNHGQSDNQIKTGANNKAYEQLSLFDVITDYEDNSLYEEDINAVEDDPVNAHINEVTSMDLPLDWVNYFDTDESTIGVEAESISDGFIKCLNNIGRVDIEYISAITGEDYKTIINELKGSIYQNPETWGECFFNGWETAEEYLSGNIKHKLDVAKQSNEDYNGYFQANIDALTKVLPPSVSNEDIYITLGSPWVPVDIISDFIYYMLYSTERPRYSEAHKVRHDEMTGTWEFGWNYKRTRSFSARERYGTRSRSPLEILLRTLNMQSVAVYDVKESDLTKSGKVSVLNKEETVHALEKQKLLVEDFQKWVWSDESRKARLMRIYAEKYLYVKQRHFNGSFLEFPTMSKDVSLFPYQKDAVARILFTPNTLLSHDVGSGKTYVMIAAGMELRRTKQSSKNLYVVPNNIIGQWKSIFKSMYPEAEILTVEPKDFTPSKRQDCLNKIRDNDYDGIIMAYSCFTQIPISNKCLSEMLNNEINKLVEVRSNSQKKTARISARIEKLFDKKAELLRADNPVGVCFDELNVTRLFVDEAHNFKNVPIETKIERVMGISKTGSKKCQDMMNKVRIVQKMNDGGGVVLATGTPITNSITDAFIMQSYLQSAQLTILDLQSFDSWIGMFAEQSTGFEIDVDTSTYRLATRFSKFHNIPELTTMMASFADFHSMDKLMGVPEHDGYEDMLVPKTKNFGLYLDYISKRADSVRSGRVRRTDDNMLKITTDGRKAALDLRLVDDSATFTVMSKVFYCAEKVADIYKKTKLNRSTQLVFCDSSTPKDGFNMYDELKELLIRMYVAEDEIAYIHDANTDAKREKLFEKVRKGEIRVLIGSTFKLGLGVNVQDKLIAIHHLDVPWRPADMIQREGRILRQGNENKKVWMYRYITEGSFDAYSWQLLETKQQFIADLLSGSIADRDGNDIDDTVLNYAEVKALAIGNPLIRERVELSNELSRYQILQRKIVTARLNYEKELSEIPEQLKRLNSLISKCEKDVEYITNNLKEYEPEEKKLIRELIFEATHSETPTKEKQSITAYQGFEVIIPARTSAVHPVIKLRKNGIYTIELTATEIGSMHRIDRCINELPRRLEDLIRRREEFLNKEKYMKEELSKDENYVDRIEELKSKIEQIDERVGVKGNNGQ